MKKGKIIHEFFSKFATMRLGCSCTGNSNWRNCLVLREKISAEESEEGTAGTVIKEIVQKVVWYK